MLGYKSHVTNYTPNKRSLNDRRRKVARIIIAYYTKEEGIEKRKGFEYPANTSEEEAFRLSPNTVEVT